MIRITKQQNDDSSFDNINSQIVELGLFPMLSELQLLFQRHPFSGNSYKICQNI